jgi:Domain of unknown function (DUF6930)
MSINQTGAAAAKKQTSARKSKKSEKQKTSSRVPNPEELLDPTSEEAKKLCGLAHYLYSYAPWEIMEETDIFGFEDPETRELGFISIMGALGQIKIIAVYRGVEALYKWKDLQHLLEVRPESDEARDTFMEIPQLQLSFEPASSLEKRDREMLNKSGLKFGQEKPLFRSYRPGYLPWFITNAEARHLIFALEQTSAVAKQFSYDPSIIPIIDELEDEKYLLRVPHFKGSKVGWRNRLRQFPLPEEMNLIPFGVEDATVERLKQIPKSGPQEIDLFTLPARIGEQGERPRLLFALLVTEVETGMVLGFEALEAVDGIDLMYASLAEKVAAIWLQHETAPAELRGQTVRLLNMFQYLAEEVGFSLILLDALPSIDAAKQSIVEAMTSGLL